jgi:hypothetical protein
MNQSCPKRLQLPMGMPRYAEPAFWLIPNEM